MDDALVVGGLEGLGNLARDHQGLGQRQARSIARSRSSRASPSTSSRTSARMPSTVSTP